MLRFETSGEASGPLHRGQAEERVGYRYASLFCWISLSLGYDATVVQGMVPMSSGLAVHSWCEIHRDGQSFVCDPDLHKFMPDIDLFMVTYDDSRLAYYHMDGTVRTNAG